MQEERERQEACSEDMDKSTDVEEEIRNLMNKKGNTEGKKRDVSEESVDSAISLMKQLTIQYDGLEAYLKAHKTDTEEEFPMEIVREIIKSSRISPALCKMIERVSEQNRSLHDEIRKSKASEAAIKKQLEDTTTGYRTMKLETKYLSQTINEATREIKKQKEEAAAQRKRIFELESALEGQRKIAKELLRDKKITNKETEIHEEEKQILQGIIEQKDKEIEQAKVSEETAVYEKKKTKREHEVLQIQYARLKKRAELKEKALSSCTAEMDRLIKQLDKLSKSDMIKKERLEYLEINRKKKEYDAQSGTAPREREKRKNPYILEKDTREHGTEAHSTERKDKRPYKELSVEREQEEQSISDIPVSFSQAVDDASVSDSEVTASSNKTTTSFREMQKRTEEMAKKFKELENLLSEIKKSNDSELDKVEERINHKHTQ